MITKMAAIAPERRLLPRTVIALGLASLFTDMASEMIYPLLPVFLAGVLGAGAISLGVIEGVAESTAALLKLVSGVWSDRLRRRKPLVLTGYGLAGAVRPLIGLATSWPMVLVIRFVDRIGKGIRTSPRDALIADVTPDHLRGAAFGLHRAMDHIGAVLGPLVAWALLSGAGWSLRHVFIAAVIPGIIVMIVLAVMVRESPRREPPTARTPLRRTIGQLGPDYRRLLLAVGIFTLGNSTDAFILLRLADAGVEPAMIAVLWSVHHVVKAGATYLGGRLSDRVGRRTMMLAGWLTYAALYASFAATDSSTALIVIFLLYGLYFGLTEPIERAWIADLAPSELRGAAFGGFHFVIGLTALPASVLFGSLWYTLGVAWAFAAGAGLALIACALLLRVRTS
jgi:MFS family permease